MSYQRIALTEPGPSHTYMDGRRETRVTPTNNGGLDTAKLKKSYQRCHWQRPHHRCARVSDEISVATTDPYDRVRVK